MYVAVIFSDPLSGIDADVHGPFNDYAQAERFLVERVRLEGLEGDVEDNPDVAQVKPLFSVGVVS